MTKSEIHAPNGYMPVSGEIENFTATAASGEEKTWARAIIVTPGKWHGVGICTVDGIAQGAKFYAWDGDFHAWHHDPARLCEIDEAQARAASDAWHEKN